MILTMILIITTIFSAQCTLLFVIMYNAACNIKDKGIRIYKEQIGSSSPEFKLVDYPTMDDKREISLKSSDRMKQEKNVV